ncbi:MAG: HAD family hydrolase [Dehalococcoidia bacterium]
MIKAVLFDLGDTLWHFPNMPPHILVREETMRRVSALLRRWGVEPEGELIFLARDIRFAVERETEKAYQTDCVSPHYPTLCREVAAGMGLSISSEQAEELWDTWNLGGQFFGRTLFPDAIDTLRWLRERGFKVGAVTDRAYGGPRFLAELEEYGVQPYLEVVTISSKVGYLKPHPKIFEHALDALAVRAEETVMVGDSLRCDVAGAKGLGMIAVWKRPPLNEPTEFGADKVDVVGEIAPDYIIDNLWELTGLPILNHG